MSDTSTENATTTTSTTQMSQETIAKRARYKYLRENIINRTLLQAQENYILSKGLTHLTPDGLPTQCNCHKRHNKRQHCNDQYCINYNTNVICNESNCRSGDKCMNRPFDRELFVLDKKQLYVHKEDGVGDGLRAGMNIPARALIGHYTGRVIAPGEKVPPEHEGYIFALGPPELGQAIDPKTADGGSALQLVNHSCAPNCIPRCVIYNNSFRLIFQAEKLIKKGEQLTIDYKWKHQLNKRDMDCLCGRKECKKTVQHESDKEEPITFHLGCCERLLDLASQAVPLHKRPEVYYETHQFFEVDHAFVLLLNDGKLRVAGANVVRTYTNKHQVTIIVVISDVTEEKELHLPSLMCFHYIEDAIFYIREGLSQNDKNALQRFLKIDPDAECAKMLKNNIILNYENQRSNDQVILVVKTRNTIQGTFGAGMAKYVLERKPEPTKDKCLGVAYEPSSSSSTSDSGSTDHEQPSTSSNSSVFYAVSATMKDCIDAFVGLTNLSKPCGGDDGNNGSDSSGTNNTVAANSSNPNKDIIEKQQEEEEKFGKLLVKMPSILPLAETTSKYEPRTRSSLESIKTIYGPSILFREVINCACKELTLYALGRVHKEHLLANDRYLQDTFREILEWNYLDAIPSERQFLTFKHYTMALEVYVPGSNNCGYCSLCDDTFNSKQDHVDHFNSTHKLVAENYTCSKCGLCEVLPSAFMKHVETCDKDMLMQIRLDVHPHIQDSFVDYLRTDTAEGDDNAKTYKCVVLPGIPFLDAEINDNNYGNAVNVGKGNITDPCGKIVAEIKVANNYEQLVDWPIHADARRPSSSPRSFPDQASASNSSSTERRGKKRSKDQQQNKGRSGRVRIQEAPGTVGRNKGNSVAVSQHSFSQSGSSKMTTRSMKTMATNKLRRMEAEEEEDDDYDEEEEADEVMDEKEDAEHEQNVRENEKEDNSKRPQTRSITRRRRDNQGDPAI